MYDVSSKRSFESLDGWLKEASKFGAKDIKVVVCANKVDGKKRVVSLKDGQAWARRRDMSIRDVRRRWRERRRSISVSLFGWSLRHTPTDHSTSTDCYCELEKSSQSYSFN